MRIYRTAVVALSLSASGLIGIALREGYSDQAIIPVKGDVPTIGFGSTRNVRLGDVTDPVSALARLGLEVNEEYEHALKACIHVPLSQREYDVWVSFAYNVGAKAFCSSTAARKLNAGEYAVACDEMLRWVYVDGKKVPGLVKRRAIERSICLKSDR